jgi:hypothetical protein
MAYFMCPHFTCPRWCCFYRPKHEYTIRQLPQKHEFVSYPESLTF